jgi:ABC-type sugar transport system, periplasmic component
MDMRKVFSLSLALILLFGFAASISAAGEQEANKRAVNVDTTAAAANNTYQMAKDPSKYKIFCYWPAPDTFFDSYVLEGITAFEKDYRAHVEWMVGTEWTQDIENQSVEAMAADGYNLFMILSADSSGANALYQELRENNFHVINYCNKVDEPAKCEAVLSSDNSVNAYASAKKLIELMGGEGEIIHVLENLNDVNTRIRQKAVEKAIAEHPGVKICQIVADITTVDEGYEKVFDALTSNPDAKGIICCAGTASKGVANALADYYGTNPDAKHIYCGTMDQAGEVLAGIRSGQIDYTVAQNGWAMGYVSALALCMLEDGWKPKNDGQFIDTGYIFIDKSNIDRWQNDIETAAADLIGALETDWFVKE